MPNVKTLTAELAQAGAGAIALRGGWEGVPLSGSLGWKCTVEAEQGCRELHLDVDIIPATISERG